MYKVLNTSVERQRLAKTQQSGDTIRIILLLRFSLRYQAPDPINLNRSTRLTYRPYLAFAEAGDSFLYSDQFNKHKNTKKTVDSLIEVLNHTRFERITFRSGVERATVAPAVLSL